MTAGRFTQHLPLCQYSKIDGELGSLKSQLQSLESDFKEFKDVNKKYTDQLIRVKVITLRDMKMLILHSSDVRYGQQ